MPLRTWVISNFAIVLSDHSCCSVANLGRVAAAQVGDHLRRA